MVEDFMFVTIFAQQWSRITSQRVNIYNFSCKDICQLQFQAVAAMVLSITKETENAGLEIVLEGCFYHLDHTFMLTIWWWSTLHSGFGVTPAPRVVQKPRLIHFCRSWQGRLKLALKVVNVNMSFHEQQKNKKIFVAKYHLVYLKNQNSKDD